MHNLIKKLTSDYPELTIEAGERFRFSPPNHLYFATDANLPEDAAKLLLLHELGHYLTGETDYSTDIELIEIEAKAWAKARDLCETYSVTYDEGFAEDRLDSYRDYLHQASLCKNCQLSGYQDNHGTYHCPLCGLSWQNKLHID